jgi:thymidylate kinase
MTRKPSSAGAARAPRVFAVVGCDGTGKSTLTADLVSELRQRVPVERRYLGLVSGEMGDRIKRLPLIGVRLEARLARKAALAQDMRRRLPGVWTALIMYGLSLWRAAHLRRVWRLARRGVVVITDRYPQAEIPGFRCDGPGLSVGRSRNRLVRWLAVREQRLYERLARYHPTLVIRLDIDAATAQRRKPDHAFAELADKAATMAKLRFDGARVLDIDARRPYPEVMAAAFAAIDPELHADAPGALP